MAGFMSGFTGGFVNQLSSGMEAKRKAQMETQRDIDRIAMTNIFETARDFQKTYAKSVGDLKKKNERFNTFMQLTNNNQAAAEAMANNPDLKPDEFDKIREISALYKDQTGYSSSIPADVQAQMEALNARVKSTFDQANKYTSKSKMLKKNGITPFEAPQLDTGAMETPGSRPAITLPPKNNDDKYQQFILTHADKFASPEAALGFFNTLRAKDGTPPVPLSESARIFAGVTFGKESKDYNNDPKFKAIVDQVAGANPDLAPDDIKKMALSRYTKDGQGDMTIQSPAYTRYLGLITQHLAAVGKFDFTQDPTTGQYKFAFTDRMKGREDRVIAALEMAQDGLRKDILMGKEPQTPAYYANGAARKHGLIGDTAPATEPADITTNERKAQRAGVGAQPQQTQHPAPQMAPPAPKNPVASPEAPWQYDANGKRIK